MNYKIFRTTPIKLSDFSLPISDIIKAVESTNAKIDHIHSKTMEMDLDVFDVIDFRVLSGVIGETFVSELSLICPELIKNPHIDGYPDLLQVSNDEMVDYFNSCTNQDFIKYKFGGLEVKNTFGTKKSGSDITQGDSRIEYINKKLDWKAHHQKTNNLIALYSDYFENKPKIAAVFYSDTLSEDDWSNVQRPKAGSAMTSFSCINRDGFNKITKGVIACYNSQLFLNHFGL